jgi:autotransporter passenger strand-loop-strand repeat protein
MDQGAQKMGITVGYDERLFIDVKFYDSSTNSNQSGSILYSGAGIDYFPGVFNIADAVVVDDGLIGIGSGGVASHATVNSGGELDDDGVADATIVNIGGVMSVYYSSIAIYTNIMGGVVRVAGGIVSNTTVGGGGGMVINYGVCSNTTLNNGGISVYDGTVIATTVNNGGSFAVYAGAAVNTIVNGGDVFLDDGTANITTVSSGSLDVGVGGVANATTVDSGGGESVDKGGIENSVTLSGGEVDFLGGAVSSQTVLFSNAGGLIELDDASQFGGVISGFADGDSIYLAGLTSVTAVTWAGGILTVTASGETIALSLAGDYVGQSFAYASYGADGTIITLGGPALALSFGGPLTEGASASLIVSAASAPTTDEEIQLSLTPGTAAASEILDLPSSVVLSAGATSVSVPFEIAQNPLATVDPETITISATSPVGSGSATGGIKEFVSAPYAFTEADGEFDYNADTNQMDGDGDVNLALSASPGASLVTVKDATATYDNTRFNASGTVYVDVGGVAAPLFEGSLTLHYAGASTTSLHDNGPFAGKFDLGGLEPTIEQLTFESGAVLAAFSVALNFTTGGLTIDTGPLGAGYGLLFNASAAQLVVPATFTLPNSGPINVFGLFTGSLKQASLSYVASDDTLKLQGTFTASQVLGSSIKAKLNFSGVNFIQFQAGVPNFVGSLSITGISGVSTPSKKAFGINEIDLSVNTEAKTLSGSILFTFPFGASAPIGDVTITGAWVNGPTVTGVNISFSDLAIAIPETPDIFWQSAALGVQNMFTDSMPTTFSGSLGFSFGPKLGGAYVGALTLSGSASAQQLTGKDQIEIVPYKLAKYLVGGAISGLSSLFPLFSSSGAVTVNFSPTTSAFQNFSFVGTTSILGNFITTSQTISADGNLDFTIAGQGTVNFGNAAFGKLSGYGLTQTANYLVSYTNGASLASDYAEAWFTTSAKLLGLSVNFTIGLKVAFDGAVSTLFSAPSGAPTSPGILSGPTPATTSPSYLFLTANWTNAATRPANLTVTTPTGAVIQQSQFAADNIAVVSALSTAYSDTVVILDPSATTGWSLGVSDGTPLGAVTVSATAPIAPPSIAALSLAGMTAAGALSLSYSLANTGGKSTISFFADHDGKNFDGIFLGRNASPKDGAGVTGVSLGALGAGLWHVYGLISDGTGIPQEVYASATISIATDEVTISTSGGPTVQYVYSGGATSGANVGSGAEETVFSGGVARTTTVRSGGLQVLSAGAIASGTVLAGGLETVSSGGKTSAVTVNSGGVEAVLAGGVIAGGVVQSGGILSGAGTESGAIAVASGGVVSGLAVASGGEILISSGGLAGALAVSAGGVIIDNGRLAYAPKTATIFAGSLSGSGVLLENGPSALILNGATSAFSGTLAISAGTVELADAWGSGKATIAWASTYGSATLQIDAADSPASGATYSGVLSNFDREYDGLDLKGVAFVSGALAVRTGAVLALTVGGHIYDFTLAGDAATAYGATSDGAGGTLIKATTKTIVPVSQPLFVQAAAAFAPAAAASNAAHVASATSGLGLVAAPMGSAVSGPAWHGA